MKVSNAKELRDWLNQQDETDLGQAYIICTYSDDIPGGEAEVNLYHEHTEDVSFEIVGGSEMV